MQTRVDAYRRGISRGPTPASPFRGSRPTPGPCSPLDGLRISRSLRQRLRRCGWTSTVDVAFEVVVDGRAGRLGGEGTWIGREIRQAYAGLWRLGWAHSLEVWDGDRLVGGPLRRGRRRLLHW